MDKNHVFIRCAPSLSPPGTGNRELTMQSEKLGLLADKRKQQGQLLKMLAIYCRRHRLMDVDIGALSPAATDAIGNELVDLFVDRVQQGEMKTPPKTGAHAAGTAGDSRRRIRGQ